MSIKVLLTFDYELFFGENFISEDEVLFKPTKKLLNVLERNNIKGIFFIDIMSLLAYKKYNKMWYVETFIKQVKKMKELGHDVQMHFHPHWIDSKYENNTWFHSYRNWSFSNLIQNKGLKKAKEIFLEAHQLFIEIVGYNPVAYRAGGYTIQPKEEKLFEILINLGYKYDTSVTPNKKFISDIQYFDYLNCENKNYWKISKNSKFIKEDLVESEYLYEFPIMSITKSEIKSNIFFNFIYILYKVKKKFLTQKKFISRGRGAKSIVKQIIYNDLSITFDKSSDQNLGMMKFLTNRYINKFKKEESLYINLLSHPKLLFNESFDTLELYIEFLNKRYNVEFVGFNELKLI